MQRRVFLSAGAVFSSACLGRTEGDDMSPVPTDRIPWNMWGSTQPTEFNLSGTGVFEASQQLARIEYKRPETWSMWFGGRITGPTFSEIVTVTADFDLILGVGRGVYNLTQPENQAGARRLLWTIPAGATPQSQGLRWSNSITSQTTGVGVGNDVEFFPAQTIQCTARVRASTILPGAGQYFLELSAFFAPLNHIRPDWLKEDGVQFAGSETGGR